MKIVIIGAVAAGTSAAAKARRNDERAQITVYEKDTYISYSGCGLPYYIGNKVDQLDKLTPRNVDFFKKKYNVDIIVGHKVVNIDPVLKQITVLNIASGEVFYDNYDKLVIATGAFAYVPNIAGMNKVQVFTLRNITDAISIKNFIDSEKPKKITIVGTGFIGFELLENLFLNNLDVTILEQANKITPNLDTDVAAFLENILVEKGIKIIKNAQIAEVNKNIIKLSNNMVLDTDMLIMATGVRPNVELAKQAGIDLGETGAIKVNEHMQTNLQDIYACGDCIETYSAITNKALYRPLGSTANKTGRIAGDSITGGNLSYRGNLSTGIFKLFELTIASTGLSQQEAMAEGYDVQVCHNIKPHKAEYLGGKEMLIKAIADKKSQRLLGVQIVGLDGVDKRIDIFATLITYKATVDDLFHLDLAYAPPFSTTKDPVHYTGMILDNAINKGRSLITPTEIPSLKGAQIIDARSPQDYLSKGNIPHAQNIPVEMLRAQLQSIDKTNPIITYCNKGVTGNAAQNILLNNGFPRVYNLSGGHNFFKESKPQ